jgi:hypothetical protein
MRGGDRNGDQGPARQHRRRNGPEARQLTPTGFELIVAPPGSADYAAALADIEYRAWQRGSDG